MSLPFNDTTNFAGLVQRYELEIGAQRGYVSGNTNRLKEFVASTRTAWDTYLGISLPSSGTWQYDDSNHTDYPIIKTNIVDGQRDYSFTSDENGNLILDIFKVAILPTATATLYQEISPVDVQSDGNTDILSENATEGVPYQYDKTANGIFFDPIPSYNATNGLKIYINREPSYFVYTDTTKKPGCPGIHHEYFALRPALDYARRNKWSAKDFSILNNRVVEFEKKIEAYFSRRERDTVDVLTYEPITYM